MNKTSQPPCPECEKLVTVSEESNKIGDFLAWLSSTKEVFLAGWYGDEFLPHDATLSNRGIQKLLAEYFDIDMKKVEQERSALLKWLQSQYEEKE